MCNSIISFFADNMLRLINKSPIVTFSYCFFSLYDIPPLFCLNCSFDRIQLAAAEIKSQRKNNDYAMFGIPNCDTIKKAKKWLEAEGIEFNFYDYRKQGINEELVKTFVQRLGWELVLNKHWYDLSPTSSRTKTR